MEPPDAGDIPGDTIGIGLDGKGEGDWERLLFTLSTWPAESVEYRDKCGLYAHNSGRVMSNLSATLLILSCLETI